MYTYIFIYLYGRLINKENVLFNIIPNKILAWEAKKNTADAQMNMFPTDIRDIRNKHNFEIEKEYPELLQEINDKIIADSRNGKISYPETLIIEMPDKETMCEITVYYRNLGYHVVHHGVNRDENFFIEIDW